MGRKGKEVVPEIEVSKETSRKTRSSSRRIEEGQASSQKKAKATSSTQRRQAPVPEPQPEEIPKHHLENKYGIRFDDEKQRRKYDILCDRGIISTRFLDDGLMCELGLDENLQWMFEKLGLESFWGVRYDTYPKYVLEFLSSVRIFNSWLHNSSKRGLVFRCNGVERVLSAKKFNEIYGFHDEGITRRDGDIVGSDFWPLISDELKFDPGHSKCTSIRNPVFRCFQKAMANTVLARGDSQNVMRTEELYFMWACFKSEAPIDMGFHFLNQLNMVAIRKKGVITIGGMLTPLFLHFGINVSTLETAPGSNVLSYDVFQASGLFCKRRGNTFLTDPPILLPCYHRLDISDPRNWKIRELGEDDEDEEMEEGDEDDEEETRDEEGDADEERQDDFSRGTYNFREIQDSLRAIQEEQVRTNTTLHQFEARQQRFEDRLDTMYQ